MRVIALLLFSFILFSCSSPRQKFKKEKVCSNQALRYLSNPRNREKSYTLNPALIQEMAKTSRSMQLCYEDFKNRTGQEEFNTCLVLGVDVAGELEFYNFGSQEVELDESFMNCAKAVTKSIDYGSYGTNYLFIQSYQFYVGDN